MLFKSIAPPQTKPNTPVAPASALHAIALIGWAKFGFIGKVKSVGARVEECANETPQGRSGFSGVADHCDVIERG